ncbi:CapA family protein [Fulvivirga ulvae]|uniref:CapA family protein n=1 Tax=Fulvivirga ulvae TaxID=2904245 RepID=UPI001F31253C|nr:CapA family protein [Fulvivirga ulvae]UII30547.1 CapA family protein [Fulvivirga ulvae]
MEIVFGGDVMLDRGIRARINTRGLEYLTEDISEVFDQADYTVVNLECPVTDQHTPLTKEYVFRAEPEWLSDLRDAGITHCIMANNHSYDHGREALVMTAENLNTADLVPVGYGLSQKKACEPVLLQKGDIEVAIFASVTLGLEAWMYLEDSPGMCQATISDLSKNIREYKKQFPQRLVVVTLHWGAEYHQTPTSIQREDAKKLIHAGTDAIIGHHPHVIQSFEYIEGKPVFYSIGNLIFDNPNPKTHEGILVKLTFEKDNQEVQVIPYKADNSKPVLMDEDEREEWFKRSVSMQGTNYNGL